MLVRATFYNFAYETSGAARIRHSLRPLCFQRERNEIENLGRNASREGEVAFSRHCEERLRRPARQKLAADNGSRPRMASAAFSATMMVGAFVLHDGTSGITEASTTRKPSMPRTLRSGVVTALSPEPIAHVPTGW